jgi:hypothetical protein
MAWLLLAALGPIALPGTGQAGQSRDEASARPDFSGVWVFNPGRSDDLRQVVEEAAGPSFTRGDARQEVVRVWIRKWLLGVLEDPTSRYLTIEQSARDFKAGVGDEISIYYFGREASSRGPAGGTLKVTVAWMGSQLLTEERSADDGRIASLYTLLPGNDTLIVAYRLEHRTLKKPLEARMVFDRVAEDD